MTIPDNVREFLLSKHRFPVLATVNPDGTIQQSVMWFDLEGDQVLMNTKKGRYKDRNRIERMFNKLKQSRRIATRYDKTGASQNLVVNVR